MFEKNNISNNNHLKSFHKVKDDNESVQEMVNKLLSSWKFYLLTTLLLVIAVKVYLEISVPVYKAQTSILVNDDNSSGLDASDVFQDLDFLGSNTNLENEIGLLKSYFLVNKVLEKLDFNTVYYEKKNFLYREVFETTPFIVKTDSFASRVLDIPIYVEFLGKNKYSIHTEGKEFFLEKYVDGQIEKTLVSDFTFADTIRIGEKLSHPYLNFELALNPNFIINEGGATSTEIEKLGEKVIQEVWKKFGVKLSWEIKIIGKKRKLNE